MLPISSNHPPYTSACFCRDVRGPPSPILLLGTLPKSSSFLLLRPLPPRDLLMTLPSDASHHCSRANRLLSTLKAHSAPAIILFGYLSFFWLPSRNLFLEGGGTCLCVWPVISLFSTECDAEPVFNVQIYWRQEGSRTKRITSRRGENVKEAAWWKRCNMDKE